MAEKIKRRAMRKDEVLAILAKQGVAVEALDIPARAISESALFKIILDQIGKIPCGNHANCLSYIRSRKACIRDHKISLRSVPEEMRRDYDQAWNQWYLCHECNSFKTHIRGIGPIYGSDAARHAKLRRLERRQDTEPKAIRCKAKIPSRPFQTGSKRWPTTSRPIPARPFPKKPR